MGLISRYSLGLDHTPRYRIVSVIMAYSNGRISLPGEFLKFCYHKTTSCAKLDPRPCINERQRRCQLVNIAGVEDRHEIIPTEKHGLQYLQQIQNQG